MPLFKFMELLESRYLCAVSVCEVNKLKDVVKISDERGARVIALTEEGLRIDSSQSMPQVCTTNYVLKSFSFQTVLDNGSTLCHSLSEEYAEYWLVRTELFFNSKHHDALVYVRCQANDVVEYPFGLYATAQVIRFT